MKLEQIFKGLETKANGNISRYAEDEKGLYRTMKAFEEMLKCLDTPEDESVEDCLVVAIEALNEGWRLLKSQLDEEQDRREGYTAEDYASVER